MLCIQHDSRRKHSGWPVHLLPFRIRGCSGISCLQVAIATLQRRLAVVAAERDALAGERAPPPAAAAAAPCCSVSCQTEAAAAAAGGLGCSSCAATKWVPGVTAQATQNNQYNVGCVAFRPGGLADAAWCAAWRRWCLAVDGQPSIL